MAKAMLPNFIVIGQAKCGTTSLCELLGGHPEIFFSDPKEPCYFSNESDFGDLSLRANYEKLFSGVTNERAIGEGTTTYTHPKIAGIVAKRIADCIPDCKIIFMVRHPLRRLESDWRMRLFEQWADKDINDAVRSNPSLITHSLYWKNFEPYTKRFPDSQRLVIFLEDFAEDPDGELKRCFDFLRVDKEQVLSNSGVRRNDSKKLRSDRWLLSKLRNSSVLDMLRKVVPDAARRWGKRLLSKEHSYPLHWQPDVQRDVTSELRSDAEVFLAYCGKRSDFWEFSGEP